MTLKELSAAIMEKKYKNSSVPKHAIPPVKLSESGANELTKAVLAYFEFKNIKAWRQASEGRYLPGNNYQDWMGRQKQEKGIYIPRSKAAKGIGDVCSVINGLFVSWEIKYKKDVQSDVQKKFETEVEQSGGKYHVIKTWAGFQEVVKQYVK